MTLTNNKIYFIPDKRITIRFNYLKETWNARNKIYYYNLFYWDDKHSTFMDDYIYNHEWEVNMREVNDEERLNHMRLEMKYDKRFSLEYSRELRILKLKRILK